jgi:hypothetical protein
MDISQTQSQSQVFNNGNDVTGSNNNRSHSRPLAVQSKNDLVEPLLTESQQPLPQLTFLDGCDNPIHSDNQQQQLHHNLSNNNNKRIQPFLSVSPTPSQLSSTHNNNNNNTNHNDSAIQSALQLPVNNDNIVLYNNNNNNLISQSSPLTGPCCPGNQLLSINKIYICYECKEQFEITQAPFKYVQFRQFVDKIYCKNCKIKYKTLKLTLKCYNDCNIKSNNLWKTKRAFQQWRKRMLHYHQLKHEVLKILEL